MEISANDWEERIFLFGPDLLPDSDFRAILPQPSGDDPAETGSMDTSPPNTVDVAEQRGTPEEPADTAGDTPRSMLSDTPSISFGVDANTGDDVRWPLTIKGNPHLLIAGLPGMGKTTCLLSMCRQMVAANIRPIVFSYHEDIDEKLQSSLESVRFVDFDGLTFNPLNVIERDARRAHLDVAGSLRDIFVAIYPELGDLQGERIRRAIKESFIESGWEGNSVGEASPDVPAFDRFLNILRSDPKPDRGLRMLLSRLDELDDYGFFRVIESAGSLWDNPEPTVIRIHTTQNDNLQRAFAALIFYSLYKDMFRRGLQERITHAVIFDEAHRAAGLKLIPTMAKECRKYGISLVLASQEARDFHVSLFSAVANYLVLRLTEADAKALVRNVANSQQERLLIDRIKQMERFKALYFSEGKVRPTPVNLSA
jgi:hypothetical protein